MKHVFVFDPNSFTDREWMMDGMIDRLGQFFKTAPEHEHVIHLSRYRRNAISLIQQEVDKSDADAENIMRVYAIGGEEILFDCINAVVHWPGMEIVSVPYGEFYDFIRIFGQDKFESFRDIHTLVTNAAVLPTDLIKWDVNYALNSCYIGLKAEVDYKRKLSDQELGRKGRGFIAKVSSFFSYVSAALNKEIATQEYTITIDGKDFSGNYSLIHIANGPYLSGKRAGSYDVTPDDGLLDVTLVKSASMVSTIISIGMHSRGKRIKNGLYLRAKEISIQSSRELCIHVDSEYFRDTGVNINAVNHAVQMAVPDKLKYPSTSASAH